ncbi:MAG: DAK2 domain-containing protein [Clostridia bacterium]|nr:DAK2 domain-containing protein [Clostridia bacterium]
MKSIRGKELRRMIIAACNNVQRNRQLIDDLNVFPVPDGDTGSNMSMTLMSVAKALKQSDSDSCSDIAKVASSGALRGARGNSGVITSQIFRGLYMSLKEKEEVSNDEFCDAIDMAREYAYKAVMKPKEGTILTIIRVMAEKAIELKGKNLDIDEILNKVVEHGKEVLEQTPDMLPALKEAGVVDSGGTGLVKIFEGLYNGYVNKDEEELEKESNEETDAQGGNVANFAAFNTEDIVFKYCTEFLVDKEKYSPAKLQTLHDYLTSGIGDSLVFVEDDDIVKVHIHTNEPTKVLDKALEIGSFVKVKVENMKVQHENVLVENNQASSNNTNSKKEEVKETKKEMPHKDIGFIAVSAGSGFNEILNNLNIDYVISGGQTMNPSTDDFMNAINEINADNIVIFPNNKNIIMAAEQAKELVEDKNIFVIKTKAVTECISAMVNYSEGMDINDVVSDMSEAITNVRTAEITYAVRDTKSNGKEITKGDIIGILDGEIKVVGKKVVEVARGIVDELASQKPDIISIYNGEDANSDETSVLETYISEKYPKMDVEVEDGNQPLYYYIISAE